MPKLKLILFGAREILLDDVPANIPRRKALAMLIYLVVTQKPQERDTLGAMFWPESADSRNQVRVALSTLRAALGTEWLAEHTDVLHMSNRQHIWVDVLAFKELCSTGFKQPDRYVEHLEQAIELARGGFLAGFTLRDCPEFNSWVLSEEYYLEREINKALRTVVECHRKAGNFERAMHYAEQLVARDDLNEDSYQLLMELHLGHNRIRDVIRVFNTCKTHLQEELGIAPSQELQTIYRRALAQRQGQEMEKTELADELIPYFHHAFFGRETEVNTVLKLLSDAKCRMVSLVGIGGIGKTHLAAKISELTPTQLNLDVCFVSLEGVQTQEQALLVVARRLHLRPMRDAPVLDQIVSRLQTKQLLLVLDNVEQLIPEINPVLSRIIQQAPTVKLLTTSRIMLRMHEEYVVRLGGLAYPHKYQEYETEEIQQCDSVRFFVYWAEKSNLAFQFSQDNAYTVAELCRVLEGIPLAIRLAAVWCELLSVEDLLREIHRNSDILHNSLSDIPEKHHSMRALFDSIWVQLSAQEQHALSHLSVFQGGFTRQAAEQIAGITPLLLKSLLEKSLLVVDSALGRRYHIHEILRMFATTNVPPGTADRPLLDRYIDYFARFLSALEADLRGYSLQQALREIDDELANIQNAWHLAIDAGRVDILSQMMTSLYLYMHYRGYWGEGHKLFEIAQTRLAHMQDAKTHHFINRLTARFVTASDAAILMLSKLIHDAQAYGDPEEVAYLTSQIGWQTSFMGRDQLSLHYFGKAIAQYQALDDEFQVAALLRGIAHSEASLGNFSAALEYNQASMSIRQRIGDPFGLSINQILQGEVYFLCAKVPLALENLLAAYDYIDAHDGEYLALKQTKLLPWCYVFAGNVTQSAAMAKRMAEVTLKLGAYGEHVLAILVLAFVASLSGNAYESEILLERAQNFLSDPDLQTGLGKFGANLTLLSKSMIALCHCLNGSVEEGHAIIAELKNLKASFMRPMIVHLLFAAEVINLYSESRGHLNRDLTGWLSEQPWLTDYMEQLRLFHV